MEKDRTRGRWKFGLCIAGPTPHGDGCGPDHGMPGEAGCLGDRLDTFGLGGDGLHFHPP